VDILVVYESSYGNTHLIANAIGEGLGTARTVEVLPVAKAAQELVDRADLVVVGGPTHVHGMTPGDPPEGRRGRAPTRKSPRP